MVYTNGIITKKDKILLFICGDYHKQDLFASYSKKMGKNHTMGLSEDNIKHLKWKDSRKTIGILKEIDDSLVFPYPISARLIKQGINETDSVIGKSLRDFEKGGLLVKNDIKWQLQKKKKQLQNLFLYFKKHGLLNVFVATHFFHDYFLPRLNTIAEKSFETIPKSKKQITGLDNYHLDYFIQNCPPLAFRLAQGINETYIEQITRFMCEFVLCLDYDTYYCREFSIYAVIYYYFLSSINYVDLNNKGFLTPLKIARDMLGSIVEQIDKSI